MAIMEKQRLVVLRGTEMEEPIYSPGRICQFKDLMVRTVLLDELYKSPEQIGKSFFIDVEIKVITISELFRIPVKTKNIFYFYKKSQKYEYFSKYRFKNMIIKT